MTGAADPPTVVTLGEPQSRWAEGDGGRGHWQAAAQDGRWTGGQGPGHWDAAPDGAGLHGVASTYHPTYGPTY